MFPEPIHDFEIVRTVLDGDRDAYAELVRRYHARVLSHCLSILLDASEADEAAQETLVKAFASLDQYKRNVSFPAWLCRIATNHCLDLLRKRQRRRTDSLDKLVEELGDSLPLPSSEDDMQDRERQETLQMALKALSRLPPEYRQVLSLREIQGLSYDEIKLVLRCSLDSVKARLRRARRQLQEEARHFTDQGTFK